MLQSVEYLENQEDPGDVPLQIAEGRDLQIELDSLFAVMGPLVVESRIGAC